MVFVYVIAFIISIIGVLSIPQDVWRLLSFGQTLLLWFSVLVGFCGVLLAYFVYVDGENLESLQSTIRSNYNQTSKPYEALVPPNTELSGAYVKLVSRYREKGFINPHLRAESKIKEKMALGKTREEAISELNSENTSKNEV